MTNMNESVPTEGCLPYVDFVCHAMNCIMMPKFRFCVIENESGAVRPHYELVNVFYVVSGGRQSLPDFPHVPLVLLRQVVFGHLERGFLFLGGMTLQHRSQCCDVHFPLSSPLSSGRSSLYSVSPHVGQNSISQIISGCLKRAVQNAQFIGGSYLFVFCIGFSDNDHTTVFISDCVKYGDIV